ncbi:FAD-dependent oxidoreductase [Sphingomonas xanthus]|uniref:D-amino-acid oxidase n=1 Tax=Sphingomonas xanthus TaxID=2594473 RepID=A0A516IR64_9SPHN|nr:FAD-dependent oxidoreductase [Sphingomonas xanthus]QDP19284.1 FAD-dependent oxidoreductase [Sphingomonas xanthus]
MLLDRRTLVGGSAALALTGCATISRRPGCSTLPPVHIDEGRLIRTVAGLRPYRESGFVVRRDALGDKALVHNYGHGGAGITLSWGSSRLATDLGLAGHSGPVAIIGSGVLGLTTARLVQEAGFPVRIYTAALPPETTSAVAGGQVSPFGHYREGRVTDVWMAQFQAAMAYSWERFQMLAGDRYGIRWLRTYEEVRRAAAPGSWIDAYYPNARLLRAEEHPFPVSPVMAFDTMYVETPRFMAQLMSDVLEAGGTLRLRKFENVADLAGLEERLLFNCTGIGARALVGDAMLIPIRGQLAVLRPQPEVRYAFAGDAGYMFPRGDGILLGGTFERGEPDPTPTPGAIARIMASHRDLFAGFRC